ncbi:hypothetical protein SARC_14960, partial [Sphaeroforma arctica JP610]
MKQSSLRTAFVPRKRASNDPRASVHVATKRLVDTSANKTSSLAQIDIDIDANQTNIQLPADINEDTSLEIGTCRKRTDVNGGGVGVDGDDVRPRMGEASTGLEMEADGSVARERLETTGSEPGIGRRVPPEMSTKTKRRKAKSKGDGTLKAWLSSASVSSAGVPKKRTTTDSL